MLLAQAQSTFYAAWEDGRDAERQGQWRLALAAYQRAVVLHPGSGAQVIIYGNNLLKGYFPYTRMARCSLELGELEAAERSLTLAETQKEPSKERESLARHLAELRLAQAPRELPRLPNKEEPSPSKTEPLPAVATPRIPDQVLPQPEKKTSEITKPLAVPKTVHPRVVVPEKPLAFEQPPNKPPVIQAPSPTAAEKGSRPLWLTGFELLAALGGILFLAQRWWGRSRSSQAAAFENPERIGPYRLERLLGRGGFASTYLARHEQSGRRVALKVLHPYRQDDPEFLGRFRQEVRLGSLLNHPNLVRVVDPGPESGAPWLAMEYVDGQRLDHLLRERGILPLTEVLTIVRAIASAMAHAHAHGVVHRDLKPGNVMLVNGQVKVLDFGIARTMDSETLTTTYAFLGTPLYAAPEVQLKSQVGPAADCYSLGIMLFELLAGHPPFSGETPFEILDKHRSAVLPDLATLRPDIPAALRELVERLCAKRPEDRPDEMEVIQILEGLG